MMSGKAAKRIRKTSAAVAAAAAIASAPLGVVTGPASVFAAANEAAGRPCYQTHLLSPRGGTVTAGSGVRLLTDAIGDADPASFDTVLVGSGNKAGLSALARDAGFAGWMARACTEARRYGSVCTGTFALAHLGLVTSERVATHWEGTALLARAYPSLSVDPDALYVEDGKVWTSAGITTGIDMCMALVARDLGEAVANSVARMLVVYARRPGYQSQFSPVLGAQSKATHGFAALLDWIGEHMHQPLDVALLADRAGAQFSPQIHGSDRADAGALPRNHAPRPRPRAAGYRRFNERDRGQVRLCDRRADVEGLRAPLWRQPGLVSRDARHGLTGGLICSAVDRNPTRGRTPLPTAPAPSGARSN